MADRKSEASLEELCAMLLKDFGEFRDEGREMYLEELIRKMREELEKD
ncbi:MAG: hypothetical protein LBS92_05415 [Candidatus Methanoplasma sp.]|jgi:hypothetical protein|nr:hypothetical protein [Candidatus Methanoplasma sp.]